MSVRIDFDPATHRYSIEGQRVLSVTQYLKLAGFVDDEWFTVEGRERGSATHAALHYYARKDLDEETVHPIVKPYFEAGKSFLIESGFKPNLVEYVVHDPIYNYVGTIDLAGLWKTSDGAILADYKTGQIEPHVALQLAAYDAALPDRHRRFAVRLKPNATYKLHEEFKDSNDIKIFRALVATVNWRIKKGMLDPERALAA